MGDKSDWFFYALGALTSIPIGIATTLITPQLLKALSKAWGSWRGIAEAFLAAEMDSYYRIRVVPSYVAARCSVMLGIIIMNMTTALMVVVMYLGDKYAGEPGFMFPVFVVKIILAYFLLSSIIPLAEIVRLQSKLYNPVYGAWRLVTFAQKHDLKLAPALRRMGYIVGDDLRSLTAKGYGAVRLDDHS